MSSIASLANDSAYFTSGNQLVPLAETNISVKKEILTITIGDDSHAKVDVYYEFYNPGNAKSLLMGFEADPPSGAVSPNPSAVGKHPYIEGFTVTMNGAKLNYKNAVSKPIEDGKLHPVNMRQWKFDEEGGLVSRTKPDKYQDYSYIYYFNATFKHGINIVRHTYSYNMDASVIFSYGISYKLSPATRWANHRIDDFTLRIKADNTAKNFIIDGTAFGSKAKITSGIGKARRQRYRDLIYNEKTKDYDYGLLPCTEVTLRNGIIEWHKFNFKPRQELSIYSADRKFSMEENYSPLYGNNIGRYYDRAYGPYYNPSEYNAAERRLIHNLPYANRGYVFKDPKLKAYFTKFWWYMPDKNWKPSAQGFTIEEQEMTKP